MTTISETDADIIQGTIKDTIVEREKFVNRFARVTQFLTWPVLYVIFHILFKINIRGSENFKKVQSPFIIISNHINFYDSFLFRLALGFMTPHLPLRFMAVTKFDWRFLNFLSSIGVVEFIYSLFGVFEVVPGLGIEKNLRGAKDIIRAGGNVVIYPEGKIFYNDGTTRDNIGPFKKGAAILMKATGSPIVPVSFRIMPHWFRRRIVVNIGGPMNMLDDLSVEEITGAFRATMEKMYGG